MYKTTLISKNHAKITYQNSCWIIESLDPKNYIYVNGLPVFKQNLSSGDIVFIFGLKLIIIVNNILINNPKNLVECNSNYFEPVQIQQNIDLRSDDQLDDEENEMSLFEENDYFFRAPRFRTVLEEKTIQIDPPPSKEKQEEIPLIYTLGPMLTMGLTSMVTGITTLLNILNKKQTLSSGLSSLVIAVAMLMTMILWPSLSKSFQKKKRKRKEKYGQYIEKERQNILTTMATQRQILIENGVPLDECKSIIINRKRNLWERKIEHDDFLNLRESLAIKHEDIEEVVYEGYKDSNYNMLNLMFNKIDKGVKPDE